MIRFEALTKRYGALCAIDELTLTVRPGEVVALLGPNGSGKSTSLKAAAGLIAPSSGDVRLGARGLSAALPEARQGLSFLPQKASFPDTLSGREVVEFYRRLRAVPAPRTDAVFHFVALDGAAERLVGTYSGGMVQRLALAVAALPEVPILLLDEPTSSLDPEGLCAFYGLIEERRKLGHAVLFSSHQLGDVERLADRVAVLVGGRLVADLTQRELAERLSEHGRLDLLYRSLQGAKS